jgi:hypothetical protein
MTISRLFGGAGVKIGMRIAFSIIIIATAALYIRTLLRTRA